MKRPDVAPAKDANVARKRALIRQLIEQTALTASAPPVASATERPLAEIIPFPRELSRQQG